MAENKITTDKYDVVIIGSGMGAMGAASMLTSAGYKILVLEKYNRLGGRFSTVEYKGYKMPTGAIGIETGGAVEKIFKELKVPFDVQPEPRLFYWIDGKTYEMPGRGGIRALLDILAKTSGERAKIVGRIGKEVAGAKIMGAFKSGLESADKLGQTMSFREWLLQYTDNEDVLAVFRCVIFAMYSLSDAEIPAKTFFHFVSKGLGGGYRVYGHARKGNLSMVEALFGAVKGRGNDVWKNADVKKIVFKNGKATGVLVHLKEENKDVEIQAQAVISNAGCRKTAQLVGRENLTPQYLKEVDGLHPCPIVTLYAGADRPFTEVPGMVNTVGCRNLYQFAPVTNTCPDTARPGKHLLVTFGGPPSSLYPMNARLELEKHIQDLKDVLPGFEDWAELLRTDTRNIDDEWPVYHSWAGYDLAHETPVPNLFNVGDSTKPSGMVGLPASAQTGINAANLVRKIVKPAKS
jgi:phytoene dehydrogenase-like protein